MKAATHYDPFNRDDDRARDAEAAAREEHEAWSREQSRLCNCAAQRENVGTWVKRPEPTEPRN